MGATHRILIPEGTYGDLMRRFDNSTNIEHEVAICLCYLYCCRFSPNFVSSSIEIPEFDDEMKLI